MHFIRTLLGLRGLYSIKKRGQYIAEALYWFVGLVVLSTTIAPIERPEHFWLACIAVATVILLIYVREAVQTNYFSRLVQQHSAVAENIGRVGQWHLGAAVLRQYEIDQRNTLNYITLQKNDIYNIYDVVISQMRSTKYGDYLAKQNGHTVFEAKLQRILPNIVFDNKQAHGRQFRYSYVASQKVSFEGNFDQFFNSYAPQTYHIDTFSFVSPEVLHAMVDFTIPCDVEIIDDRLLCYAPLMPPAELEQFKQQCLNLHQHLIDNVDTYRDDRLTGKDRQVSTTPFARKLLENPLSHWVSLLIFGLLSAGIITAAIVVGDMDIILNELSFYAFAPFIYEAGRAVKIWHANRQEIRRFERLMAFMQSPDPRDGATTSAHRMRFRV